MGLPRPRVRESRRGGSLDQFATNYRGLVPWCRIDRRWPRCEHLGKHCTAVCNCPENGCPSPRKVAASLHYAQCFSYRNGLPHTSRLGNGCCIAPQRGSPVLAGRSVNRASIATQAPCWRHFPSPGCRGRNAPNGRGRPHLFQGGARPVDAQPAPLPAKTTRLPSRASYNRNVWAMEK